MDKARSTAPIGSGTIAIRVLGIMLVVCGPELYAVFGNATCTSRDVDAPAVTATRKFVILRLSNDI